VPQGAVIVEIRLSPTELRGTNGPEIHHCTTLHQGLVQAAVEQSPTISSGPSL